MFDVRICRDLEEVHRLWQRHWPRHCLCDLWPVRNCFQRHFQQRPHVLVAERQGTFGGMLALSWIEEEQYFGHCPGELWHGKTWLEQNRMPAVSPLAREALWEAAPDRARIRYLHPDGGLPRDPSLSVDETGYLFRPPRYGYDFNAYMGAFSGRTRKKMRSEIDRLQARGVTFRYNRLADVDRLFRLNMDAFGSNSYFSDPRFLRAFEDLVVWLRSHDLLRVTTVLVGGAMAAVDIGAVWNGIYTVVAGGACSEFPGVAKLINFHHLEWACRQQLHEVDVLCGEFNWKHRFHLTPRPLYQMVKRAAVEAVAVPDPNPASDVVYAAG